MIAAAIATIIGTAAAGLPIYDRITQWRRSRFDSQRSKEGGGECVMLNSPSTTKAENTSCVIGVEVKIFIVVPSDQKLVSAAVTNVQRAIEAEFGPLDRDKLLPISVRLDDEKP